MATCRACGARLYDDEDVCPDCGERVRPRRRYDDDDRYDEDEYDERRPAKPSGPATASFVLGIVGIVIWIGIFMIVFANPKKFQGKRQDEKLNALVGCAGLTVVALNVAGAVLGITAAQRRSSNKWMATTGLVINISMFALFVVLMVLGLAVMKQQGAG